MRTKQRKQKSALMLHAERELELAFADPTDSLTDQEKSLNNFVKKSTLTLIETLSSHGHGALTTSLVSDIFAKLSRYLPLSPLTGEDNEWSSPDETGLMQNIRYAGVFKNKLGETYDTNARVFVSPDGSAFIDPEQSTKAVIFPYYPSIEYVHLLEEPEKVQANINPPKLVY